MFEAWKGSFYQRGSVKFPKEVPTEEMFRKKMLPHGCSGSCNQFETIEVLGEDYELIKFMQNLEPEVQQFLVSTASIDLARELVREEEYHRRTLVILQ